MMAGTMNACFPHTSRARACRMAVGFALALLFGACHHDLYVAFDPPVLCRTVGTVSSSVFLIGDAGDPELPDPEAEGAVELVDPVLSALAADVAERAAELGPDGTAVVFLGDNVYPAGMPPPGEKGHERAARILDAQVASVGPARGFFLLGNHDWKQGKKDGYAAAIAQVRYLETRAPNIEIQPPSACPGPAVVDFGDHLRLLFGDVWSAMYGIDYPDSPLASCEPPPGEGRVLAAFAEELENPDGRRLVVLVHPPMMTTGPHGGYFPWDAHVFPFRVFHRDLWIPLPVVGSIFPISRQLGVTDTDVMSRRYRDYVEGLRSLLSPGVPTLIAAGHEHSLQIHVDPLGIFHVVSGAGSASKVDHVRRLTSDLMSLAAPGYMRLDAYDDASLRLTVTALDDDLEPETVFYTCIP
jgi:hypothetical protein